MAPEVIEAMRPFFEDLWGNPSSMHQFGGQVAQYVEQAREKVASFLGASPSEIVFTSCGTESDNTAIFGAADVAGRAWPVITSRVEHPAVLQTCRRCKDIGYRLVEIGVDGNGNLDMDELHKSLSNGPAIVSLMWANNETGVVFPIDKIAAMVKEAGGILHTDAVQAAGKIPVDLSRTPVDLLSISGHKLHAPKGIGVLYIRKGTKLNPFLLGGHQEQGRRGGTENVPYIVGLGRACDLAMETIRDEQTRIATLRDKLEKELLGICPDTTINGAGTDRLPNTTSISFEFIEGEAILYHLSDLGIAASSGSACASGSLEPSHVIRAMGIPFTSAHGTIRFSLSRYNTEADIDYVIEKMPPIVERLRKLSPFVS